MGGCSSKQTASQPVDEHVVKEASGATRQTSIKGGTSSAHSNNNDSMHSRIVRLRKKKDPFTKYESVGMLGRGSMGFVAKVRIKEGEEGGSAFKPVKKTIVGDITAKSNSSLSDSERRKRQIMYALKTIMLDLVNDKFMEELDNEIDILKGMDHPNIVKLHEVFDYKKQIFLILELCDGGDLYTRTPYSEQQAAVIVGKTLSAIKYMVSKKNVGPHSLFVFLDLTIDCLLFFLEWNLSFVETTSLARSWNSS